MSKINNKTIILLFTLLSVISTIFLFRQYYDVLTINKVSYYLTASISYIIILILIIIFSFALLYYLEKKHIRIISIDQGKINKSIKGIVALVSILIISILWGLLLNIDAALIIKMLIYFLALWSTFLLGYINLKLQLSDAHQLILFFSSIIITSAIFTCFLFLEKISLYPFSTVWSEGTQYVNAHLIINWIKSNFTSPLPILDPARYILLSFAFLISKNILVHRLWQALLWILIPLLTSFAFIKRLNLKDNFFKVILILFCFVYFHQGPVYYHLLLSIIPIIIWFNPEKPVRSVIIIVLSSIWAALSRINWYFMPITVAFLLTLLENRDQLFTKRKIINYFTWAGVAAISVITTKYMYLTYSGNPASYFDTALSSSLLWYRFWPNSTFPPGILLGTIIVLLPLFCIVFILRNSIKQNALRLLLVAGILLVYFAGSLVVSVKIGGGSNLHNLDSFLVLYLFTCILLLKDGISQLDLKKISLTRNKLANWCVLAVTMPLLVIVFSNTSTLVYKNMDHSITNVRIQEYIDQLGKNSTIMCINNCQLFSFDYLKADHVEGKYEKIILMEMAMADNKLYMDDFRNDIMEKRFPLIISEKLDTTIEERNKTFGEENNIWVEQVSAFVLQYYKPLQYYKNVDIEILVPIE